MLIRFLSTPFEPWQTKSTNLAGVPHGYTSCVMLPHVLRFNEQVNSEKQARVSGALGRPGEPAADVVAGLIAGLDLPTRLRDESG